MPTSPGAPLRSARDGFAACGRVVAYLTGRCEHLRAFTREQLAEARLLAGPLLMQSRPGILPLITGEKGADLASFYVYYTKVGIIMRAIRRIHDRGHLVLECLAPWSGHEGIGNLRRYLRKVRKLVREAGSRSDLKS